MKAYPSLANNINWDRSVKRHWFDITALWRGRYKLLHIDLPIVSEGDSKELE